MGKGVGGMRWASAASAGYVCVWSACIAATAVAAPPTCAGAAAGLNENYSFIIGSADYNDADGDPERHSAYRWLVGYTPFDFGTVDELLLLHFDNSLSGVGGETPTDAEGVTYADGRWGAALALQSAGAVRFAREDNLDLRKGTIEMWVASRADGGDPIYADRSHHLFQYRTPNDDFIAITQDGGTGALYAGGVVNGQWQSAFNGSVTTRYWQAGEWHHLAYTFSAAENFMRFYLDGRLVADTSQGHYVPPSDDGGDFFIGGDVWGHEAHYLIDELRVSARVSPDREIRARANRLAPPAPYEVWLDAERLQLGDSVVFAFTPSDGDDTGHPCVSESVTYPGIPITDPDPPSTILPPKTSEVLLSVTTAAPTECRYAVGTPLAFDHMMPFDAGAGTTQHQAGVTGIDTDTEVTTNVYVRCASSPGFLLALQYRCLSEANPSFPRTANLWGSTMFIQQGMQRASGIDLWLGAEFTPSQIRALRALNPDIRILTSINTVERPGLPEDYYLHDIHGNRVEVWPGTHRLNMTKLYVAENQARHAYRRITDSDLMFDGCFFDNVMTTQSWQTHDIFGNPFLYDYNEDGEVDDPAEFDAAWKTGVFHELDAFRELMPHALMCGHAMDIAEPGIADIFNGIGIGFLTADVIEGDTEFGTLWDRYQAWHEMPVQPHITMVESTPMDQIAYGYGYLPWRDAPGSTLEFARKYYPYVRFGLALTLMRDGFFAHEFGDIWHGNDWWYDELDFDLGYPLGAARFVDIGDVPNPGLIENGGFEEPIDPPWSLWVVTDGSSAATVTRDLDDAPEGTASARIDVESTSGEAWHVDFAQFDRTLIDGTLYDVVFWAKADTERTITLGAQRSGPPWDNFGLWREVPIDTAWREYAVSFTATQTTSESRIQFMSGDTTGSVWVDDVRVHQKLPHVARRDFTHGTVLLNPMREPMVIDLEPGYRRLSGSQAARFEHIIDDRNDAFSTTGGWTEVNHDSGEWQAVGPFYHDWGEACHESSGAADDTARWNLTIPATDAYTISVWWPAAPVANTWSRIVDYDVVAGGMVVATVTLDQRGGGDEWHPIAEVPLAPDDDAYVRASSRDGAPCIADALHVRSAARYNDGSPAAQVTLQPMDGIILERYAGDFDSDGDTDEADLARFASCFSGPGAAHAAGCSPGDFDLDHDVDCTDWGSFMRAWIGAPDAPPQFPQCNTGVPTASEWQLVTLSLLLCTGGTILFRPTRPTRLGA